MFLADTTSVWSSGTAAKTVLILRWSKRGLASLSFATPWSSASPGLQVCPVLAPLHTHYLCTLRATHHRRQHNASLAASPSAWIYLRHPALICIQNWLNSNARARAHTHTHTHTHTRTHTHTHTLSLSLARSLTLTRTHSHFLTLTLTHSHSRARAPHCQRACFSAPTTCGGREFFARGKNSKTWSSTLPCGSLGSHPPTSMATHLSCDGQETTLDMLWPSE
jgi:hypothetical protein